MKKIQLKEVGMVPAKRAGDFRPGEVIARHYGYTLKVIEVQSSIDESKVKMKVEHVPEECEYHDGRSWHSVEYSSGELLGVAKKHGNEGLC